MKLPVLQSGAGTVSHAVSRWFCQQWPLGARGKIGGTLIMSPRLVFAQLTTANNGVFPADGKTIEQYKSHVPCQGSHKSRTSHAPPNSNSLRVIRTSIERKTHSKHRLAFRHFLVTSIRKFWNAVPTNKTENVYFGTLRVFYTSILSKFHISRWLCSSIMT
jgi:hypothetical protein